MSNSTWLEQEREAQQERDADYWERVNRHLPTTPETQMSTEVAPSTPVQFPTDYPLTENSIAKLADECMPLMINGIDDRAGYNIVHRARMMVKDKRISVEKRRKELKADALAFGRTVDARAKQLTALLAPIETHLIKQETAVDDEKRRLANAARLEAELAAKAIEDAKAAELKRIADEEAARVKAEQDAEAERLRVERAEFEAAQFAEQERQHEAQKKLDAEREALERKRLKDEQAAHVARMAEEKRQRQAQDKLDAQARVIEAEKKRLADIEAERVRAEELAAAKVVAAEQAQKELLASQAREAEAEAAKVKAEADAKARAEALRPDKDKLLAVADAVAGIALPHVTPAAGEALKQVGQVLDTMERTIRDIAKGLS